MGHTGGDGARWLGSATSGDAVTRMRFPLHQVWGSPNIERRQFPPYMAQQRQDRTKHVYAGEIIKRPHHRASSGSGLSRRGTRVEEP